MKVLSDNILVRRDPIEEKTQGGVILPGVSNIKPNTGTVVAVGPGYQAGVEALSIGDLTKTTTSFVATTIKEGDKVFFNPKFAHELDFRGEKVVVMRERDVIAVVSEATTAA